MLINRDNYEAFFLDFIEGKMNSEEEAVLMAFLSENPDLEQELNSFEQVGLNPEFAVYGNKNSLKKTIGDLKSISQENFDQYCIAKMEGDLDDVSAALFEDFLSKHPEKIKDYKQFLLTFLEPNNQIIFAEKHKLRRRIIAPARNRVFLATSIAASISLIALSYYFYNSYEQEHKKIYSSINEKLKIDSLLSEKILGNSKTENQQISSTRTVKYKEKKLVNDKDTIKPIIPILKKHQPIEIVELDSKLESPLAQRALITPLAPINNRNSYLTVKEFASKELKKQLDKEDLMVDGNLSLWQAAKSSVKQINKLTGLNISMNKELDSANNRTRLVIHSDLLSFYSSSSKK